ncbi:ADP-ribosylglycohydrolase family protein [Bifidobacterium aerophilum]|uniref:ADP-ribosylglycohydrolase n=1 Tax=Bifidobacterium aerophilum TaxID=1798155 RepID=A0A6N9Z1R2_9BIFI|nr:ADP-ribosylglycohydrolase family protein [Bifidobacterium aerophilum]NEG88567.1 ADP-ribosylglycohydrolase [Bifidobacterium aerophilum]
MTGTTTASARQAVSRHEAARRILVGVAYGDAMGMPTETLTQSQIRSRFGRVTGFLPSPHGDDIPFDRDFAAGQVTDDTDNTLMLCRMLTRTGGRIDADLFVAELTDWLDRDPTSAFAVGPSTRRALEAIKAGVPLDQAGRMGTTNGAAMKIAPIGIIDAHRGLPRLVSDVTAVCIPTHNTTVAIQGAAVAAACVGYGMRIATGDGTVDWDEWYGLIDDALREAARYGHAYPSADLACRIAYGRELADGERDDARFEERLYSFMGTGLETSETIPAAVSIAYRYRGDLRRAVECAANAGGDTDTIGAICGAMCAGLGFDLPDDAVRTLEEVNQVDFDAVATSLVDACGAGEEEHNHTERSAQ